MHVEGGDRSGMHVVQSGQLHLVLRFRPDLGVEAARSGYRVISAFANSSKLPSISMGSDAPCDLSDWNCPETLSSEKISRYSSNSSLPSPSVLERNSRELQPVSGTLDGEESIVIIDDKEESIVIIDDKEESIVIIDGFAETENVLRDEYLVRTEQPEVTEQVRISWRDQQQSTCLQSTGSDSTELYEPPSFVIIQENPVADKENVSNQLLGLTSSRLHQIEPDPVSSGRAESTVIDRTDSSLDATSRTPRPDNNQNTQKPECHLPLSEENNRRIDEQLAAPVCPSLPKLRQSASGNITETACYKKTDLPFTNYLVTDEGRKQVSNPAEIDRCNQIEVESVEYAQLLTYEEGKTQPNIWSDIKLNNQIKADKKLALEISSEERKKEIQENKDRAFAVGIAGNATKTQQQIREEIDKLKAEQYRV